MSKENKNDMPEFLRKLNAVEIQDIDGFKEFMDKGLTGIIWNCPREVYNEIPAIRQSDFKLWLQDQKYYPFEKKYPKEPTDALTHGTLFDVMLFDSQEEFERRYAFGPDVNRNTKEWKTWAEGQPEGVEMFKQSDLERFTAFKESFTAHAQWRQYMEDEHAFQVVCLAKIGETYIKAALDMLTPSCIVDAKLLADATDVAFGKSYLTGYGYDIQAAWYRYCCPIQGIPMYFACQEKHRFPEAVPGSCQWFQPADEDIATAMRLIMRDLPKFAEALKTGVYEGYPQGIATIKVPVYAERQA